MVADDPFKSDKALNTIIKNLEMRWGLTLVSFLDKKTQNSVLEVQNEVINKLLAQPAKKRYYFKLYELDHLHFTHFTLTRSDPNGPVVKTKFIKSGHNLSSLFEIIHYLTSKIKPFQAQFNRVSVSFDNIGIMLVGECLNQESFDNGTILINELNQKLPELFNLSRRTWDSNPDKYKEIHCMLCYLKRPIPEGYKIFVEKVAKINIQPINFTIDKMTLVHHRYRSLSSPHEGHFNFPLGKRISVDHNDFIKKININ